MEASEDFQTLQQNIQAALVAVSRSVSNIASEDLTFQRTVNPDVAAQLDDHAARLLRLTNGLLQSSAKATGRSAPPELEDADDVELNWRGVVDVIDALLEKADTSLDEYTGMLKRKDAPTTEVGPEFKKPKPTTERLDWSIRRANIPKPQELFERKPNNFYRGPWKPLLSTKPHAVVPLDKSFALFVDENGTTQYKHPYETEITQMHYPEAVYHQAEPIRYLPPETTAATWVDTWEGVLAMLEELRKADVIAVDLEHHDFRTYTGLLSLMQISTREKDWVVDTLKPWRHRLEILNEVFADPRKIKVFHGATSDIVWLQRDLGLYIVGLFDTYFACDCLEYPARSLAYLLKRFVQFDADKKYQMADWRIRPLSEEMLYYARSDTHYLLYVYDMVRNELADKDLTAYVLGKSKETSLLRHETLLCDPETGAGSRGWLNSLMRTYASLDGQQFATFKALFEWRDELARKLDESPGYLMPIRTLGDMARILPSDRKAMWSLLNNTARETKAAMDDIFLLIQQARARGANGPSSAEFLRSDAVSAFKKTTTTSTTTTTTTESTGAARTKEVSKLPDISQVRSGVSQLWGSMPISSRKKQPEADDDTAGVQTKAPWFSLVQAAVSAGIFTDDKKKGKKEAETEAGTGAGTKADDSDFIEFPQSAGTPVTPYKTTTVPAATETAETTEKASSDEETFTLKGGKRSRKESKKTKKDRRKDRSSEKSNKSSKSNKSNKSNKSGQDKDSGQAQTSDSDGGAPVAAGESEDFVPFNYDTAGSVMQAKNPKAGEGKKVFNPYRAKTGADGPKAARQMHYEKTGKSATFKK